MISLLPVPLNSSKITASMRLPVSISAVFFFSSRRRHTRSLRDWSSDVCFRSEPGAHEIEDQTGRPVEREVVHLDGALEVDHDLHLARPGAHADGANFAVPAVPAGREGCSWRRGEYEQRGECRRVLHGVSSCLASDSVSCRSNPNSCTVKTISRGRICVTLSRPMMSPVFT